jgi:glycerophosphoryl diester phosphodiesterase
MKTHEDLAFYEGAHAGPIAIPHRGGDGANEISADGNIVDKQNTMAAFRSAARALVEHGLPQYAETDLTTTNDDALLALHGSGTPRQRLVTTLEIPTRSEISRMSAAQVAASVRIGGEKIPRLEEVLEELPEMHIFVDPKTDAAAIALAGMLKVNKRYSDRICVGSFSKQRNQGFADLMGDAKPAMSIALGDSGTLLRLLRQGDRDVIARYCAASYATSGNALWLFGRMKNGRYVEDLQAAGWPVFGHKWLPSTIDESTARKMLEEWHFSGIMANQTELIAGVVATRRAKAK